MWNAIVEAVIQVGLFKIMVDDARSSKTKQLLLCIRFADALKERFVSSVDCSSSRDSEGNTQVTMDSLQTLKPEDSRPVKWWGSCYVRPHIWRAETNESKHPVTMYFHCLAQKLNLMLADACTVNRMPVGFFNTIEQLFKSLANPGLHVTFQNMQKMLGFKA